MQGKIIKGIAGFYYVYVAESGLYECKAKGIFRKEKRKPLVGDDVTIELIDEADKTGNIVDLLPRRNQLIRPAVANIDQAIIIFAIIQPKPNFGLLDRFLVMMESQGVDTIICFNKTDIATAEQQEYLRQVYHGCGCRVMFSNVVEHEGTAEIMAVLEGKTTAVAGPSGVGKSSIINILQPEAAMETGEISRKIDRGKHTTRHSELIAVKDNTFIMDTPGFSSLYMEGLEKEELKEYFYEFQEYEPYCRFQGCVHINEPGCGVKEAVIDGKINAVRYNSYAELYEELKNKRRY